MYLESVEFHSKQWWQFKPEAPVEILSTNVVAIESSSKAVVPVGFVQG